MKNENVTKLIISQNWWCFQISKTSLRRQVWLKLNILPLESLRFMNKFYEHKLLRSDAILFSLIREDLTPENLPLGIVTPQSFSSKRTPYKVSPTSILSKVTCLLTPQKQSSQPIHSRT